MDALVTDAIRSALIAARDSGSPVRVTYRAGQGKAQQPLTLPPMRVLWFGSSRTRAGHRRESAFLGGHGQVALARIIHITTEGGAA